MARNFNSQRARQAGDPPDIAALKGDWLACVNDRKGNYWDRARINWETRYTFWSGQTADGKKWPSRLAKRVYPWPGAADSRVPLVDKYIREDVALLMQIFSTHRLLVRPTQPSKDAAWANRLSGLLRWLVYEEMEETEAEAELLANLLLERGCAALGIWWDREETMTRDTLSMEPILAAAEQARRRLAAGETGESLLFQAQLPVLIADPTLEQQAVELFATLAPESNLTPQRVRQVLRDLRTSGTASFPRPIVSKNRPCLRTLEWNQDIWLPPEVTDLQRSRQVFTRELLTEADIAQRARQYGWADAATDELLDRCQGRVTEIWETPTKRGQANFNALGETQTEKLYEVITAYERLVDADGVPGIYLTTFSPALSDEQNPLATTLLDYAHGKYPFAVFASERRSRLLDDARGYGEVASTFQAQVKRQWDARIDRTDVATLPPSHHPPGEEPDAWGPGVRIPTMQPERFGYFEIPKPDMGSKEIEETVRKFSDEYFGRPVDEQNTTEARLLKQELVRKWLAGWKQAHTQVLQLCQQYLPDEFFFRVVGGEQGRGIKATREEIQGPFNVSLKFNVGDLDTEWVKEKLALMQQALAMDVGGIVDRTEAIGAAMELVDPGYAERLLRPAEAAALREIKDEQDVLAKLLLGIQVDVQGDEAFMLRKQALEAGIQNNATAQQIIQSNPQVQDNVKRRLQQLDFNIQQKMVNPEIGRRLGTAPSNQTPGAPPTPAMPQ